MPSTKRDYYEVLGVAREASADEIRTSYRKLALKYHPDKNPGDTTAEERFKEAAEAYGVLSDPAKRANYDRFGHAAVDGAAGFHDVGDIFSAFSDIFGSDLFGTLFGTAGGRGGRPCGASLRAEIHVTLAEVAEGTTKSISLKKRLACAACGATGSRGRQPPVTCPACRGRGQVSANQGFFSIRRTCPRCHGEGGVVESPCGECGGDGLVMGKREISLRIPPGVDDGVILRVAGEGEDAPRGGEPGDLQCLIRTEEHPLFQRSADPPSDLIVEVPVPVSTALLGGDVDVPSLDGVQTIRLDPSTAPGSLVRVRGQGLPRFQRSGRGDLWVRVLYDVPKSPGRALRKAIESLQQAEREETGPARRRYSDLLKEHQKSKDKKK